MTKLAEIWSIAANDLKLEIVSPFILVMPDKTEIEFDVLLKNFGFENGMLLTDDYSIVESSGDAIVDMGYGYSVMGPYSERATYDRETYVDVLADWTWSGPKDQRPGWLPDPPVDDDEC